MKKLLPLFLLFLTFSHLFSQTPRFPFPHHQKYNKGTIRPSNFTQFQLDSITAAFYDEWKKRYLNNSCSEKQYFVFFDEAHANKKISTSEGQGYGMMITAYIAGYDPEAKTYFDGLYNFYKAHPSITNNRLMAWCQVEGCKDKPDGGNTSASDGDIDIAYSLLLADKQWGSDGKIDYLNEAKEMIKAIMKDEVNRTIWTTKLCDCINETSKTYSDTRSSDFIIDHFRAFWKITKDKKWLKVIDEDYYLLWLMQTNFSPETGLLPDFIEQCNTEPIPAQPNYLESSYDGNYYYNACRVPLRIAADYLIYGDKRGLQTVETINKWIKLKTDNSPENIKAGYTLGGKALPHSDYYSPSFIAPFAVGAMVSKDNQKWLNDLYKYLIYSDIKNFRYFDNTLKMLSLIVLSRNYWSPK
jgi:endo-1,4-beta-D-glucanase Y